METRRHTVEIDPRRALLANGIGAIDITPHLPHLPFAPGNGGPVVAIGIRGPIGHAPTTAEQVGCVVVDLEEAAVLIAEVYEAFSAAGAGPALHAAVEGQRSVSRMLARERERERERERRGPAAVHQPVERHRDPQIPRQRIEDAPADRYDSPAPGQPVPPYVEGYGYGGRRS